MRRTLPAFAFALSTFALPAPAAEPPFIAPTGPRTPAEEAKAFHLPPGFEAQLVASEPDIHKPINMAFDARGRLWVTDSVEYPFPAADGQGRDSVKVLEDFGPDGRARKVTTFADGLNIPIGVLPYQDGAVVYSIPGIWRLHDTDGDGKADHRELLYGGLGHRDTHGMVNGFVLGFDGWLYCCHGYANDSVVRGKDGPVRLELLRRRPVPGGVPRPDGPRRRGQQLHQPLRHRPPGRHLHGPPAQGRLPAQRRPVVPAGGHQARPGRGVVRRRLLQPD